MKFCPLLTEGPPNFQLVVIRQKANNWVAEGLDRYCASVEQVALFPEAKICRIEVTFSNHFPIQLKFFGSRDSRRRRNKKIRKYVDIA